MFHEIDTKWEGGEFAWQKRETIFFFGQPVFQKYTLNGPVWLFLIILHSRNYMSFNLYADLHTGQNINPIPLPSEGCKRLLIEKYEEYLHMTSQQQKKAGEING